MNELLEKILRTLKARASSEAIATRRQGAIERLSYSEFETLIAGACATIGDRRGRAIGIFGQKTGECYAALVASLLSGNHFVPLNPAHPIERLLKICELARVELILTDQENFQAAMSLRASSFVRGIERVTPRQGLDVSVVETPEDGLAYIMFTSGSGGEPKGVMIARRNLGAAINGLDRIIAARPDDRFSQIFDLSFDLSLGEIVLALSSGATLISIPTYEIALAAKILKRERITVWGSTPTHAQILIEGGVAKAGEFADLRFSLFCGEALRESVAKAWAAAAPNSIIENFYGPTEATLYVSHYRFEHDRTLNSTTLSIGMPFEGCRIEVVDPGLGKIKTGATGEILIGGEQVGLGYVGDPEKTTAAFVSPSWANGTRWYRSGDLGYFAADGNLEFAGRADRQIKIQGHRLELSEVESVLARECPEISWNVIPFPVSAKGDILGTVAVFPAEPDSIRLQKALQKCALSLPSYAVPKTAYVLSPWPVSSSGKFDLALAQGALRDGKGKIIIIAGSQ